MPDAPTAAPGARAGPSCAELAQQLREILLGFPCGLLDGVRWSALCRAHAERSRRLRWPGAEPSAAELVAARASLDEVADFEEDPGAQDGVLWIRESLALAPAEQGSLACWPGLLQRLGQIVRDEGARVPLRTLRPAPGGEGGEDGQWGTALAGGPTPLAGDVEVAGVLLSRLKPLLRKHWDAGFDERNLSFYKEDGSLVVAKKMKHLVEWLLKWRDRRLALAAARCAPSAVDAALEGPPLALALPERHNDLLLCCLPSSTAGPAGAAPEAERGPREASGGTSPGARAADRREGPRSAPPAAAPAAAQPRAERPAQAEVASPPRAEAQQLDALEKEIRRLRIESAELKKRLRFEGGEGREFLHKEIRRLRIENAELKKRVFPFPHSPHMTPPYLIPQPIWVSAPAVLAPMVAAPSADDPQQMSPPATCAHTPGSVVASGQASPAMHGAATPVQQAFCYAMPLAQGLTSPAGGPWRAMGPILHAVPIGGAHMVGSGASSAMSPMSDVSHQERLLPRRLCSSDPDSSHIASHASLISDTVHPESRSDADVVAGAVAGAPAAAPSWGGPDECWVCIPSGIVERKKAQFEGRGGGDAAAEAAAPAAPGDSGGVAGDTTDGAADAVEAAALGGGCAAAAGRAAARPPTPEELRAAEGSAVDRTPSPEERHMSMSR